MCVLGRLEGQRGRRWLLGLVAALACAVVPAQANAFVYWSNTHFGEGTSLGRANLDGTGVDQSFITGAVGPVQVAVNSRYIYWANANAGTIARANLDGSSPNERFITGASGAEDGVAVDGTYIYWVDNSIGTIGRANLDGTGVNHNFMSLGTDNDLFNLAVDSSHIYWSDYDGRIGRANLDGTGANQNFITGASYPVGVAVNGSHVYWANSQTSSSNINAGTIGRANLDGSGVNQNFITGASTPYGLALDSKYIYWSNESNGTIGRANLDGSGVNQSFITGADYPQGVAVDALTSDKDLSIATAANITTTPTGPGGATVTYTPPAATDEAGETLVANCSPASGSTFPIGTATVTCTATDSDDTNSPVSSQFTVTVTNAPTTMTAAPQLVLLPPGGIGLGNVSATLSSFGQPVAGRTITFTSGGTQLCSATTAATGTASCKVTLLGELAVLLSNRYMATFAGDSDYLPSIANAAAIEIGGGLALPAAAGRTHVAITHAALSGHGVRYAIGAPHGRLPSGRRRLQPLRAGRYKVAVTLTDGRVLRRTVTLR
jgi:virginiamycin B lyase